MVSNNFFIIHINNLTKVDKVKGLCCYVCHYVHCFPYQVSRSFFFSSTVSVCASTISCNKVPPECAMLRFGAPGDTFSQYQQLLGVHHFTGVPFREIFWKPQGERNSPKPVSVKHG